MSAIYYEKTPGALVATGQRTVSTYPSGLCRIDRTYVCPDYAADAARLALQVGEALPDDDGTPAIDGAFIFPAPQETRRGDGFVEFAVSAYGRTSETAKVTNLEQRSAYFYAALFTPGTVVSRFLNCNFWDIYGTITIPLFDRIEFEELAIPPELLLPFGLSLSGHPTWSARIITTVRSLRMQQPAPGTTDSFFYRNAKELSITFNEDNAEVANTSARIYVIDPYTQITSTRSFGKFKEIDFVVTRDYLIDLQLI